MAAVRLLGALKNRPLGRHVTAYGTYTQGAISPSFQLDEPSI